MPITAPTLRTFGFRATLLASAFDRAPDPGVLFAATFVLPDPQVRLWIAAIYIGLAIMFATANRKQILPTLKAPFQLPRKR